jgi:DNA-binding CsgD family transcriptional regulator
MLSSNLYYAKLSPREKEVAVLIIGGATTNMIARSLNLKPNTISSFKKKIFVKFEIDSEVDLYRILKNA